MVVETLVNNALNENIIRDSGQPFKTFSTASYTMIHVRRALELPALVLALISGGSSSSVARDFA